MSLSYSYTFEQFTYCYSEGTSFIYFQYCYGYFPALKKEIDELYQIRWGAEEGYKIFKARVQVEAFSGKTLVPEGIDPGHKKSIAWEMLFSILSGHGDIDSAAI